MFKLDVIKNKILTLPELRKQIACWNLKNKKIVFTNGCFDIMHLGHIDYLSKAADLGNVLIVGLNSDNSISRIKGPDRPVIRQEQRSMFLASMLFVSAVVLFEEDTPYELIKFVQPDILVKAKDYKAEEIVGYDIVKNKGGEIITLDFLEGYSTTAIINKIRGLSSQK